MAKQVMEVQTQKSRFVGNAHAPKKVDYLLAVRQPDELVIREQHKISLPADLHVDVKAIVQTATEGYYELLKDVIQTPAAIESESTFSITMIQED